MTMFVAFLKLPLKEAVENMLIAEKFFRENPKRKVARTDLFKIRRGYVVEDIMKHAKREGE